MSFVVLSCEHCGAKWAPAGEASVNVTLSALGPPCGTCCHSNPGSAGLHFCSAACFLAFFARPEGADGLRAAAKAACDMAAGRFGGVT